MTRPALCQAQATITRRLENSYQLLAANSKKGRFKSAPLEDEAVFVRRGSKRREEEAAFYISRCYTCRGRELHLLMLG